MATESEIVTLDIEIRDAAVTQTGFGVPLIAAVHTFWSARVRTFETLSELTAAPLNVPTTSDLYRAAAALLRQQPAVRSFKIGKLATSDVAADLAAIRADDGDWYVLVLASQVKADILDAAEWAETERVLLLATTTDAVVATPDIEGGSDDLGTELQAAAYRRTALLYHHVAAQHAATAWAGRMLPKDAGTATWANKELAGVDTSTLTIEQRQTLTSRNVNYYVPIKGIGFTLHGVTSSGRFIDIVQGMDWFDVRTQERIVGLFARNDRVAFTDKGIELFRTQVEAQVQEGIAAGIIDGDSPWAVTAPLRAEVDANSVIARTLPRLRFNFVLAGAVHKVAIQGTVLVAL